MNNIWNDVWLVIGVVVAVIGSCVTILAMVDAVEDMGRGIADALRGDDEEVDE